MPDAFRPANMYEGQWLLGKALDTYSSQGPTATFSVQNVLAPNAITTTLGGSTCTALVVAGNFGGGGTQTVTITGRVTADQGSSGVQPWPVQLTAPATVSVGTIAAVSVSAIPSISVSAIPSISVSAIPSVLASISAMPALSISANVSQSVSVSAIPSISVSAIPAISISAIPAVTIAAQPIGVSNTITSNMVVSQGPPGGTATSDGWVIRQPNSTASILYVNPGPTDLNNALSPWNVKAAQGAATASANAWYIQGAAATTSAMTLNPVPVGLLCMSTLPATNATGRAIYQLADVRGRAINRAYLPVARTMVTVGVTGSGTNSVTGIAAPGAGNVIAIFRMDVYNADSATQEWRLLNGATNSILYRGFLASNDNALIDFQAEPLELAANTAAGFNLLAAVGTRSVVVDLWYATYAT